MRSGRADHSARRARASYASPSPSSYPSPPPSPSPSSARRAPSSSSRRRAAAPGPAPSREPAPSHDWAHDIIRAPGTPEAAWAAWAAPRGFPELDLTPLRSVLVVAAHPDDEVLALGGTLARLADSGARLRLVAVTDGEASHPDSTAPLARDLARVRRAEARRALEVLGAPDVEIVPLGLPDTAVARHELSLTERLLGLMSGFDACAAPWTGDAHPDHEAAGRAAAAACAATGVPVLHYPVWAWHWATPGDPRVPWRRAARVPLDAWTAARKRAALDCFASQVRPLGEHPADAAVLPPAELAHFQREYEIVLRHAPGTHEVPEDHEVPVVEPEVPVEGRGTAADGRELGPDEEQRTTEAPGGGV
ncbi:PIG-L deacetylase family protein [Streptomyces iconiensis]|uniref:PIG-L deacetylase family protein n=1 Tax=Streptomyces iconiensis TaxID=1384038 RepID=UPI00321981BD